MSSMNDVERDLELEMLAGRLAETTALARSAIEMVAVLVMKMGGEVEITNEDVVAVQAFDLAQIAQPERNVYVVRVERKRPN